MSLINNAKWASFSQVFKIALQFVGLAIFSRLVPASEFGVMALVVSVTNFANLFRDMGTAAAIIQREVLPDTLKTAVFWLNLTVGALLGLALVLSADLLAAYFHEGHLASALLVVSISFPISASSAVHQALLERDSHFRVLAAIEITSAILGLVTGAFVAWLGYGVMGLVAQSVANAIASSVGLWMASRWRPDWKPGWSECRNILGFSGNLSMFNFVNYFARNVDTMIIARACSSFDLGMYSMAYRLMLFPLQSMTFVASRALFPILSRRQCSLEEMGRTYLSSMGAVSLITAPMMGGLWVTRDVFAPVMLGPSWSMVSTLLAWLAPVGYIQSILSTTGTTFMATGRTDLLFRLGVFGAVLQVGAFVLGVKWGVLGVVVCYFTATIVNSIPAIKLAVNQFNKSIRDVILTLAPSVVSSLIMVFVLTLYRSMELVVGFGMYFEFFSSLLVGGLSYFLAFHFWFEDRLKEIRRAVRL